MGSRATGGRGTRVRKLVDLRNLRRQALGGFDPLLKVGIFWQLSLGLRVQLVQLEKKQIKGRDWVEEPVFPVQLENMKTLPSVQCAR